MSDTAKDRDLNPLELEQRGVNVPGDEGLVKGEPGAGTERNPSAPPPQLNVKETGDIDGASSTHAGAGGNFPGQTGGVGTAPNDVE